MFVNLEPAPPSPWAWKVLYACAAGRDKSGRELQKSGVLRRQRPHGRIGSEPRLARCLPHDPPACEIAGISGRLQLPG
jgi:hypothetical protein